MVIKITHGNFAAHEKKVVPTILIKGDGYFSYMGQSYGNVVNKVYNVLA